MNEIENTNDLENDDELNDNEQDDDVWNYCSSCYELCMSCTICGLFICEECTDIYLDFCEQHNGFICSYCCDTNGINVFVCTKCHRLSCTLCIKFFTCHTILCESCIEQETCHSCHNVTDCTTCKVCNIDAVIEFNEECPCYVCSSKLPFISTEERRAYTLQESSDDIKCLNYFKCTCKMHYECQITHRTICEECFEICINCRTFFDKRISVGDICILCKYKEIQSTYNNITKTFPIEIIQQICQY